MKKALSLSGSSFKGSTLSIEVSKKRARDDKKGNLSSRGGFTSPRGGFTSPRGASNQGGSNRGELQWITFDIDFSLIPKKQSEI